MLRQLKELPSQLKEVPVRISDSLSGLRLFSIKKFRATGKKTIGSRKGCIGFFDTDDKLDLKDLAAKEAKSQLPPQPYLVKFETFAYPVSCAKDENESVTLESICSNVIRHVFGPEFAAEIHLAQLYSTSANDVRNESYKEYTFKFADRQESITIESKSRIRICIASKLESNAAPLQGGYSDSILFAQRMTRIITMAMLINMDDFKYENIVRRNNDGSLFLVDCAGNLAGYENTNNMLKGNYKAINIEAIFQRDVALQTLRTFVAFPLENIAKILSDYNRKLSKTFTEDTAKTLINNFAKTQDAVRALLCQIQAKRSFSMFETSPQADTAKFARNVEPQSYLSF